MGETAAQNAAVAAGAGNAIGDCIEDTFSVSTAGGSGSPVICGTNTGYHSKFLIMTTKGLCIVIWFILVILDNTGAACQTANFRIGSSGGVTRMWEIKVQQFACGNEDVSGPPGCLQYYTGAKGNIERYIFPNICAVFGQNETLKILLKTYFIELLFMVHESHFFFILRDCCLKIVVLDCFYQRSQGFIFVC